MTTAIDESRAGEGPDKNGTEKMMSGLSYAFVSDWLAVSGGAEIAFGAMTHMYPGPIYASQCNRELFEWLEGHELRTSFVQRLPLALTKHYVYAPVMPFVYRRFDFSEFDVLIVASHSFAHHCRARKGAAYLCYYHTPARSLWNPEIDDRASAGRLAWLRRGMAPFYKKIDLAASAGPTYLVANSQTTAARIQEHYGRKADAIVYPPVFTETWLDVPRTSTDAGFVMWGRQVRYKRTDLAIRAVKITGDQLHIVGIGAELAHLQKIADGMPNVHFHGRMPTDDLKALMARCKGVLFPGYEDFGIVPVEAMAAGLPVVAYAAGGATETVSSRGVLFHEQSPEALAEAIRELDRRQFDPQTLRDWSLQYDAKVFDQKFRSCVQEAVERSGIKLL